MLSEKQYFAYTFEIAVHAFTRLFVSVSSLSTQCHFVVFFFSLVVYMWVTDLVAFRCTKAKYTGCIRSSTFLLNCRFSNKSSAFFLRGGGRKKYVAKLCIWFKYRYLKSSLVDLGSSGLHIDRLLLFFQSYSLDEILDLFYFNKNVIQDLPQVV